MARTTRAMAMAMKWVVATNGNTTGNGYRCPLSSVVATVAAVWQPIFVWCGGENKMV
jgi:hypothetical protein